MSIPLYLPDGRCVAVVEGDSLRKWVRGSVHQLRQPPAWAVDAQILEQAERLGARSIEIFDTETGQTFRCDLATFRKRALLIDRGYGRQWALPLAYWSVSQPNRPGQPVQLALPLPFSEAA